jgi:hypothetical protein
MSAEDGVKGIITYRRLEMPRARRPPTTRICTIGHASPNNGADSALHAYRSSSHARSVRRPHENPSTRKVHGTSGSIEILQTRFLGTLLPCLVGLTRYQNMSTSCIALLDLKPVPARDAGPRMPIVTVRYTSDNGGDSFDKVNTSVFLRKWRDDEFRCRLSSVISHATSAWDPKVLDTLVQATP